MRDLKADLETCQSATPGPWETEYGAGYCVINEDVIVCSDIWQNDADFIAQAREGWPHAIERAIKAEAEVERLLDLLETHHSKCVVCEPVSEIARLEADVRVLRDIGKVTKDLISPLIINENETLKSELARYKRALELASLYIDKELDQCPVPLPNDCHDNCLYCMSQYFLRQDLAELDKEGTVER